MKGIGIQKLNILIIIGILFFLISIGSSQYINTLRYKYTPTSAYIPSEGETTFYFDVTEPMTIPPSSKRESPTTKRDSTKRTQSICLGYTSSPTMIYFSIQTAITHKICSELSLFLTSPSEITSRLVDKNGGSFGNLYNGTLFIDSAQYTAATFPFTKNGMVSPLQPLTLFEGFNGGETYGTWSFMMKDFLNDGIYGTLHWLELIIQGSFSSSSLFSFLFSFLLSFIFYLFLDGCLIGNPCQHGGICVSSGPTSYDCNCAEGYEGQNCTDGIS